jgi:hypothetical protein
MQRSNLLQRSNLMQNLTVMRIPSLATALLSESDQLQYVQCAIAGYAIEFKSIWNSSKQQRPTQTASSKQQRPTQTAIL